MESQKRKNKSIDDTEQPERKKTTIGIKEDVKKNADHYRRVGALSISTTLLFLSLCMGDTVAGINSSYDPETAEIRDIRRLLQAVAEDADD